jgi:diguanylate cyclase (GGDEF)-like protein
MSRPGLTLQNRITTLMILSSVIFISVFTFIQINNQANAVNRYNIYKAGMSSNLVNLNLEAIIRQAQPADLAKLVQAAIKEFKDTNTIEEATVFTPDGNIIASTDHNLLGTSVGFKDLGRVQVLSAEKWLAPDIDRTRQAIIMYLALQVDPGATAPLSYGVKLIFPLGNIQEALTAVYKPVVNTAIIIILANLLLALAISKTVIGPIKVLNQVTKIIAAGDLNVRTKINTGDELQELGETFNNMTEELIKMKARAENANPLTKLPGNIVIHEQIEDRIKNNKKFVVIYCDLDNFKSFNDKYGIAKGDEAIILAAEVFKEAAKNKGGSQDFIGHEGGDDFIMITTPDKTQGVADYITQEFDKRIRSLYSQEDLNQGFIIAHGRDNTVKQFPIMTISLAGVSNESRPVSSYAEVTNIAAEVKKKAKAIGKSVFVLDKRTT